MANYQMNPALRETWMTQARNKVICGGRASSKSHDAAGMAVFLAANFKLKFLCVRQFQNKITDSVYTLLANKIDESDYRGEFRITNNSIIHKFTGSEFIFYGLARNIDEVKSTEGVDVLWCEEAHALTKEQWEILEPTIRKDSSECWIIFNPQFITDFVWQYFVVKKPDDTIVTYINYPDNPFLSATMLKVIDNAKKIMTDDEFRNIYLGEPKSNNDMSVIPYKYLVAATDAHKKLDWPELGPDAIKQVGFDVADDGDDDNALTYTEGNILRHVEFWRGLEDELLQSCSRVFNFAVEHDARIVYDSIGVGATCGSKFKELNDSRAGVGLGGVEYHAFNAGSGVPDPDEVYLELPHTTITVGEHFENAKAYEWFTFAQKLRNTYEAVTFGANYPVEDMVSIDSGMPNLEALFLELSTPHKKFSLNGKSMVERKQDLRKRGIPSPNMADSAIMSVLTPTQESRGILDF
ncbi:PBSX family terminase large subunit [Aeromonas phage Gekk3-15]